MNDIRLYQGAEIKIDCDIILGIGSEIFFLNFGWAHRAFKPALYVVQRLVSWIYRLPNSILNESSWAFKKEQMTNYSYTFLYTLSPLKIHRCHLPYHNPTIYSIQFDSQGCHILRTLWLKFKNLNILFSIHKSINIIFLLSSRSPMKKRLLCCLNLETKPKTVKSVKWNFHLLVIYFFLNKKKKGFVILINFPFDSWSLAAWWNGCW